ncbi:MAG: hypothetical protein QXI87_09270 [Thermoproteota archaeon]
MSGFKWPCGGSRMKTKKIGKIKVRKKGRDSQGMEKLEIKLQINIPGSSVGGIKSETMTRNKLCEVRLVKSGLDATFKPRAF